ncbi:hypothetical protein Q0590_29210 [Rhodocytophaga aerolata]|uniref:Uncharacterized protein n=1 Tax=Rhodocytophaga aerolata TaxID=455078 RepID=A0ABT8REB8_9BACT|nr:hypothetical protein [Rhodocytophaga aerolata]MDO1450390.1 hypothetical protein [Rhodocytophaga aerolata]
MWYFTIKQQDLTTKQYQSMQRLAELTEVIAFNEPYYNFCLFDVKKERYQRVMDFLDMEGISYSLSPHKPSRDELLESMQT